jgi:hypothetical protein
MMRLVTQFDDRRTRATVATPTCCCCCCCCVASIVSTTVVTVLNVNDVALEAQAPAARRWLCVTAAVAALPVALFAAGAATALTEDESGLGTGIGLIAFFVVWTAALVLAYREAGLRSTSRPVGVTVTLGTLLFAVELFVAGSYLVDSEAGFGLYLAGVAVAVPFVLVPLLRRLSMSRR